ncbi:hypothetical protein B0H17DRAFT_1127626 [Mycena rosella]|uniref:Uncharacterized protein n=1 Tax=Mycena rosella TaxID=1033263 RepID=A0AAD7DZR8_MYCRO|nr:hypothetical protein B0H17DRAFT_1127626 [Mycena rosella]
MAQVEYKKGRSDNLKTIMGRRKTRRLIARELSSHRKSRHGITPRPRSKLDQSQTCYSNASSSGKSEWVHPTSKISKDSESRTNLSQLPLCNKIFPFLDPGSCQRIVSQLIICQDSAHKLRDESAPLGALPGLGSRFALGIEILIQVGSGNGPSSSRMSTSYYTPVVLAVSVIQVRTPHLISCAITLVSRKKTQETQEWPTLKSNEHLLPYANGSGKARVTVRVQCLRAKYRLGAPPSTRFPMKNLLKPLASN